MGITCAKVSLARLPDEPRSGHSSSGRPLLSHSLHPSGVPAARSSEGFIE